MQRVKNLEEGQRIILAKSGEIAQQLEEVMHLNVDGASSHVPPPNPVSTRGKPSKRARGAGRGRGGHIPQARIEEIVEEDKGEGSSTGAKRPHKRAKLVVDN